MGITAWSGAIDDVPITRNRECLATLDIQDRTHPKLKKLNAQRSSVKLGSIEKELVETVEIIL